MRFSLRSTRRAGRGANAACGTLAQVYSPTGTSVAHGGGCENEGRARESAPAEVGSLSIPKPTPRERSKPKRIARRSRIAKRGPAPTRRARPKMKRDTPLARAEQQADALWSAIVMAEANGICEPCKFLRGVEHAAVDPAHLISRRYQATKHIPSNGVAACRKMHDLLKDHPPGREESRMKSFAVEYRGKFVFDTLERLALRGSKFEPVTLVLLKARAASMGIRLEGR